MQLMLSSLVQGLLNLACARSRRGDEPPSPRLKGTESVPWIPIGGVLGFIGVIVALRLALQWHLPFPQCWLRKFTGVPCPTCGCTRSLVAWAQFDPAEALFLNPLFFLVCAGVILWPVLAAFEKISRREWFSAVWARVSRRRAWQVAAVLVAVNWLYLWLRLPK